VLLANPNGKPCGGGQVNAGRRWGHLVYRGGPRRPTSPCSPLGLPTVHVSPATNAGAVSAGRRAGLASCPAGARRFGWHRLTDAASRPSMP
jgi:hypothetical protein